LHFGHHLRRTAQHYVSSKGTVANRTTLTALALSALVVGGAAVALAPSPVEPVPGLTERDVREVCKLAHDSAQVHPWSAFRHLTTVLGMRRAPSALRVSLRLVPESMNRQMHLRLGAIAKDAYGGVVVPVLWDKRPHLTVTLRKGKDEHWYVWGTS
jgi:hypothetical protein